LSRPRYVSYKYLNPPQLTSEQRRELVSTLGSSKTLQPEQMQSTEDRKAKTNSRRPRDLGSEKDVASCRLQSIPLQICDSPLPRKISAPRSHICWFLFYLLTRRSSKSSKSPQSGESIRLSQFVRCQHFRNELLKDRKNREHRCSNGDTTDET
jgi:hypothetical protein